MTSLPSGPGIPVTLSSSAVYPLGVEAAFEAAARLGYDGIELMVLGDPLTTDVALLRRWSEQYGMPISSIHAPTLLVTQRVWGTTDPWEKLDRSIELAYDLGSDVVVLHPPFRWQKKYARGFAEGVADREERTGMVLAVENMFPWRAKSRDVQAYLPHWDPVPQPYDHVTLDLSHAATSGSDVLQMQSDLGSRLKHVHLGDGSGSFMDEHLVPGRGAQPCDTFVSRLPEMGYTGHVCLEVSTRKQTPQGRDADLLEALRFAREFLGHPVPEQEPRPHPRHREFVTLRAGAARRRVRRADRQVRRAHRKVVKHQLRATARRGRIALKNERRAERLEVRLAKKQGRLAMQVEERTARQERRAAKAHNRALRRDSHDSRY